MGGLIVNIIGCKRLPVLAGESTPSWSAFGLGLDASGKALHVDDEPVVRSLGNFLLLVIGLHLAGDSAAVHRDNLRVKSRSHSHRGSGEMADIDVRADSVEALFELILDRVAGGHLQAGDQVGCPQHSRGFRAEEINGHVAGYQ
jgi:hypothetical protein